MQPIMAEIANADPETFKRIHAADDWEVTVIDDPTDLLPLIKANPPVGMAILDGMGQANGMTIVSTDDTPVPPEFKGVYRNTWLNRPYINAEAASYDVSPVKYAADILVHEFAHREDYAEEPEAYDAGIEFARKMGEPVIMHAQNNTKTEVQRREKEYAGAFQAPRKSPVEELIETILGQRRGL
jgi:hypothetical protein